MKISCGIYLFRNDNKFLVGHPTGFKSHIWAIPKGRMDVGETDHFEVAKRELKEETCIDLTTLEFVNSEFYYLRQNDEVYVLPDRLSQIFDYSPKHQTYHNPFANHHTLIFCKW